MCCNDKEGCGAGARHSRGGKCCNGKEGDGHDGTGYVATVRNATNVTALDIATVKKAAGGGRCTACCNSKEGGRRGTGQ